jgi:hypothetical protein
MGYYTSLKFKAKLKHDIPEEVLGILKRVLIEKCLVPSYKKLFNSQDVFKVDIKHPFFQCERWFAVFLFTNCDNSKKGGKLYQKNDSWIIDLDTEFKNYDDEIENFLDWISPFIAGRKKKQYVGFYQGEDSDSQVNLYIKR